MVRFFEHRSVRFDSVRNRSFDIVRIGFVPYGYFYGSDIVDRTKIRPPPALDNTYILHKTIVLNNAFPRPHALVFGVGLVKFLGYFVNVPSFFFMH